MSETFVQLGRAFKADPFLLEELPLHEAPDALELNHLRPELYAIVGVIAEKVMDRVIDTAEIYPPYGLSTPALTTVSQLPDFEELQTSLNQTLVGRGHDVVKELKEEASPLTTRLDYLCSLFRTSGKDRYHNSYSLLTAGLITASSSSVDALKAVSRKVRSQEAEADSLRIAQVARNSGRLLTKIAALPLSQLNDVLITLREADQAPLPNTLTDFQSLVYKTAADGQPYVDFVMPLSQMPSAIDAFHRPLGQVLPPAARHLGCPANARIGDQTVTNRLWNWVIDIAEAEDLLVTDDAYRPRRTNAA